MDVVIDSNGTHHFVYLNKTYVVYKTDQGGLEIVAKDANSDKNFMLNNLYPVSLAVDDLNRPYVCYAKITTLYCAYKSGNSWKSVQVGQGIHPSMQIDKDNDLHLAYYDIQKKVLMYALSTDFGVTWDADVVDHAIGTKLYPSIAVDGRKFVYISYYDKDNEQLRYAFGQKGFWSLYIPDSTNDNTGMFSKIILDKNNNPIIAYYDQTLHRVKIVYGTSK
jgi:hypothetical protein